MMRHGHCLVGTCPDPPRPSSRWRTYLRDESVAAFRGGYPGCASRRGIGRPGDEPLGAAVPAVGIRRKASPRRPAAQPGGPS